MQQTNKKIYVSGVIVIALAALFVLRTEVFAAVPTDAVLVSYTNSDLVKLIQQSSAILATRFATPTPSETPPPTTSIMPTPTPTTAFQTGAWIYPGNPTCNASVEFQSRKIHTLKAEYFTLNSVGSLVTRTEAIDGCNGYSAANAALVKANSQEQYITISANHNSMMAMYNNATKRAAFITTTTNFVKQIGFTGIDIDFEEFGAWSASDYSAYKALMTSLGNSLHASGKKLMVNLPPIGNATMQSYYPLKYEDFNTLPIDVYTVMAYDYQFDYGAGTPVQPMAWLNSVIDWSIAKFTDDSKIAIGIPNYGYQGQTGSYTLSILTYDQIKSKPGFSTAKRDASSQEMTWVNSGTSYYYSDTTTLNTKIAAVTAKGINKISVWHLGGNQWFSGY